MGARINQILVGTTTATTTITTTTTTKPLGILTVYWAQHYSVFATLSSPLSSPLLLSPYIPFSNPTSTAPPFSTHILLPPPSSLPVPPLTSTYPCAHTPLLHPHPPLASILTPTPLFLRPPPPTLASFTLTSSIPPPPSSNLPLFLSRLQPILSLLPPTPNSSRERG